MKICNKCGVEKDYINFYVKIGSKDNYAYSCKECMKKEHKNYCEINKEKLKQNKKEYYIEYKDFNKENSKKYYLDNKDKIIKRTKEYKLNNKEYVKEYNASYIIENKEKIKQNRIKNKDKTNKYLKEKFNKNPLLKINGNIRTAVYSSLKKNKFSKNLKTEEIIGCSFDEFKNYLQNKFESWMNWGNYGKYNGELNYGWDIDHIIPLSSVNTEEEIIKLNHHSNLQPLCSYTNRYVKMYKY